MASYGSAWRKQTYDQKSENKLAGISNGVVAAIGESEKRRRYQAALGGGVVAMQNGVKHQRRAAKKSA